MADKKIKICLVGSSGGHLTHLYMLKPFWKNKERFWVTFDKEDAKSLLQGEKMYGYECTESSVTGRYKKDFQKYQIDEYYSMRDRFEKYDLDIDVASVEFWHKGEKDYIKNELKSNQDIFEVAHKTVSWINGYPEIMRYLRTIDKNAGLRSKIRTRMLQFNLKYLVSIIDTAIIKKKCDKLREIR